MELTWIPIQNQHIYIQNSNVFSLKDTIILFIAVEDYEKDVSLHGIAWFYENKRKEYLVKDMKS